MGQDAAHDQRPALVGRLGSATWARAPMLSTISTHASSSMLATGAVMALCIRTEIENRTWLASHRSMVFVGPEPGVRPQRQPPRRAGTTHPADDFLHEALGAPGSVGVCPPGADVKDLAGVGPGRQQRMQN